jgi:uncharacterized protein (DUF697 family)
MALALESAPQIWQRVDQFLANQNANPALVGQFKALRAYLVQQKGNPQLQFIPFGDALLVTSTGYSPIGVASTLYGVFFAKVGANGVGTATDSWLTIANDASNTTDATKFVALMTSVAGQQVSATYPNGLIFGTDLTLTGETSAQDGTESTAGDSGMGFVIIGA